MFLSSRLSRFHKVGGGLGPTYYDRELQYLNADGVFYLNILDRRAADHLSGHSFGKDIALVRTKGQPKSPEAHTICKNMHMCSRDRKSTRLNSSHLGISYAV